MSAAERRIFIARVNHQERLANRYLQRINRDLPMPRAHAAALLIERAKSTVSGLED